MGSIGAAKYHPDRYCRQLARWSANRLPNSDYHSRLRHALRGWISYCIRIGEDPRHGHDQREGNGNQDGKLGELIPIVIARLSGFVQQQLKQEFVIAFRVALSRHASRYPVTSEGAEEDHDGSPVQSR
jgi:hypothetical protein